MNKEFEEMIKKAIDAELEKTPDEMLTMEKEVLGLNLE